MKKVIIIVSVLIFGISLGMPQNLQQQMQQQTQQEQRDAEIQRRQEAQRQQNLRDAIERQEREAAERRATEERRAREQREAEEQRRREREQRYQSAIASAQRNFEQRQYVQARQDYMTARELRPESAVHINARIAEIDERILDIERQHAEAEREQRYQNAIASARINFEQRQFEQAIQSYRTALEIRPENAVHINARIAEVTRRMNEPALLRIYRPRPQILSGATVSLLPVRYNILLDNVVVGERTTSNWATTVTVTTFGTQTLSAEIDGRRVELHINFEPGGVYYVRAGTTSQTRNTGRTTTTTNPRTGRTTTSPVTETLFTPSLQLVDRSIGSYEFNAIEGRRNRR